MLEAIQVGEEHRADAVFCNWDREHMQLGASLALCMRSLCSAVILLQRSAALPTPS